MKGEETKINSFKTSFQQLLQLNGVWLLILCFGALLCSNTVVSGELFNDPDRLKVFVDDVMVAQLEKHYIPGATLSIVKDGEILLAEGYGYADLNNNTPVDPNSTLFRPGSISKLFTWTAVMQLVEQGHLDLDEDINTYLDFQIPDGLMQRGGRADPLPITMRNLLTHTPGFEDVLEDLFVLSLDRALPLDAYLKKHLPARVFPPGQVLAYSNYGTALAGYIVELLSGQPFAAYVEENILLPLGMVSSSFHQPLPDNLAPHLANAYKYFQGRFHQGDFEYIPMNPAGAMSSTAVDLARFMIAHLQQGRYEDERILEEETARTMHEQQFTQHPKQSGVTFGFFESTINGQRVLEHSGATMLFYSQLFLVPEEQLGLFVSYSGGDNPNELMQLPGRLFREIMDHYYPATNDSLPAPPAGARERAAQYLGEYHPTRMSYTGPEKFMGLLQSAQIDMTDEGYMLAHFMGQPYEFVEVEPGFFRSRNVAEQPLVDALAFKEGPNGQLLLSTGAMTFLRAPWYGSLAFLGSLIVFALFLMIATLLGWAIGWTAQRIRGRAIPLTGMGERIPRLTVVVFFLATIVFLLGMGYVFTDIDPAYGVPNIIFGIAPPVMNVIFALPWIMIFLGIAMVLFSALSWIKGYWNRLARIHYSLLTAAVLGLLWVLAYTNQI